ncbi:sensor domain-containing diguanylate cyclase [Acetobacterium wieringae]|uniref:sensor domain-containing diguanylate cyclase n=1 Tax=Acetobacterium wieringae TaxID=52694 RepID=UPI002B211E1E|nr:sensor domain-containing diguanylate cyclase [Acetobacterium wieringae]MEA4806294.1 sensor domain-containing diguanylate cyclase [Acetobacterium wieringae]
MIDKTFKDTNKTILYTLGVFLIFSLGYFLITLVIQINADTAQKNKLLAQQQQLVAVEKTIISNKVNRLATDLLYATDALALGDNGRGDYSDAEDHWLAFANRKMIYDQIRFIDVDGNEVIRVNYDENGATLTDSDDLQNKADRYYFTAGINLAQNQIYVSPLDLNKENDQIEQPIKPMIRLATPYYGARGQLLGLVVLNYTANDLLAQVEKIATASQGQVFMLNADGYWLYNSADPNRAWGFMYDNRLNDSFKTDFPEVWSTIQSQKNSTLTTTAGVFAYTNILTATELELDLHHTLAPGLGDWTMVSFIPATTPEGQLLTRSLAATMLLVLRNNLFAYLLILTLAVFAGVILTINQVKNDEIKYYSEYDAMTGVFNRRTGFEKLKQLYKNIEKNEKLVSVCFIDINGLKDVNDFLGHDAGDELIIAVTRGIQNNIRSNDFLARLGGDEFLIIFEGLDEAEAEAAWQRIVEEYEQINATENRRYLISASHGIETISGSSNEYIDSIINQADEKMYREKKIIKKNLKIVRDFVPDDETGSPE